MSRTTFSSYTNEQSCARTHVDTATPVAIPAFKYCLVSDWFAKRTANCPLATTSRVFCALRRFSLTSPSLLHPVDYMIHIIDMHFHAFSHFFDTVPQLFQFSHPFPGINAENQRHQAVDLGYTRTGRFAHCVPKQGLPVVSWA